MCRLQFGAPDASGAEARSATYKYSVIDYADDGEFVTMIASECTHARAHMCCVELRAYTARLCKYIVSVTSVSTAQPTLLLVHVAHMIKQFVDAATADASRCAFCAAAHTCAHSHCFQLTSPHGTH